MATTSAQALALPDQSGRRDAPTRILMAAEQLFAEQGYEAVSISAIAERAEISKANVFHHFSSKRELYLAVVRSACRRATEHLEHLEAHEGSFAQRFTGYAVSTLEGMIKRERLHRLTLRELLAEDDQGFAKELADRVLGEKFGRLVAILRGGQARGELRSDFDPAMAAVMLLGANIFFLQARNLLRHLPDADCAKDSERYSTLLADILLRGMLPKSADFQ